jgi:hypothetical protein
MARDCGERSELVVDVRMAGGERERVRVGENELEREYIGEYIY